VDGKEDIAAQPATPPTRHRVVFLIGYRGTGKTSIARILAERLCWSSIDADEELETRFGRSIRQIFDEEGEGGFRDKEAAVLRDICRQQWCVVATGGGVILRPENRELLRKCGSVVWLTADAHTIWERLQKDAATRERRPALTIGGLAEIEELLQVREALYRGCADLTVNTVGRTVEDVASAILEQLSVSD